MHLIRIRDSIVIIVHCVCSIWLQEKASFSLSQSICILLTSVREIEIENAEIFMMKEEKTWAASREIILLETDIVRQFNSKAKVWTELLIQDALYSHIEICLSKSW